MGEIAEAFGEVIRELGLLIPLALKRQFQGIYRPIPNGEDMIDYFLDPHPDEVLYSVWARLSDGLGYRRQQDVLHDLFGTMSAIPIVDLPCHLGYFFEHLPRWHTYTLDTLINQHTLYPLHAPFLPEDRFRRLRAQMISGSALAVHHFVGKLGNRADFIFAPPW